MKQFVDDTHLHGVKELYHAPTLFKVLWLLVILGSIGFCAYETFKVLQEYVEAKPITQISVQAPLKFPPVLFCPPDWLNESAIEELGISESVLMYGLGYLWEFSNAIKKEHSLFKAVLGNLTAIQSEFNALLNSTFNNEIDAFLKFVSVSSNSSIYCRHCDNNFPRPRISPSGTCYLMEFQPLKDPFLQDDYYFIYYPQEDDNFAKNHDWLKADQERKESKAAALFLGNDVSLYMPYDYVAMYADEPVRIQYTATLHKRINTKDQPCFAVDSNDLDLSTIRDQFRHCQSICAIEFWEECESNKCQIWMPFGRFGRKLTKSRYCGFQDFMGESCDELDDENDLMKRIIEKNQQCLQGCKPPCTEWTFNYAKDKFVGLDANDTKDFVAKFTFLHPLGSLVFTQKESYSWDTLISNVGGQLGLWLGASVLSFFQAFYLLYVGHPKKGKETAKVSNAKEEAVSRV